MITWRSLLVSCVCVPVFGQAAEAQANLQLWGNFTADWVRSDQVTYEIDIEPKVLLNAPEGEPGWWNVDVTPGVEYTANSRLDVIGELATGYTRQTDDHNSIELSPRAGIRFHVWSRDVRSPLSLLAERPPRRRLVLRDLIRIEGRNHFYSDDTESSFNVRFRNRLELMAPLNTRLISDDGARYVLADWEWFIPLGDPEERFASRQRIRMGLGYRRDARQRVEIVYIWTRSRNTIGEPFSTSDNIIDIRVKRVF